MLDVGQAVYDFIGEIPSYIASAYDAISNLTVSDVLDGIQGILDVVGFIPGLGEIADGINGVISLARGDYVGAALSFTSMIPIVGDAIGKGGKAARFIAKRSTTSSRRASGSSARSLERDVLLRARRSGFLLPRITRLLWA